MRKVSDCPFSGWLTMRASTSPTLICSTRCRKLPVAVMSVPTSTVPEGVSWSTLGTSRTISAPEWTKETTEEPSK